MTELNNTSNRLHPRHILGIVALMLVTVIAYLPAIHAGYIWDDESYVINNVLLRDLDGLQRIWIPFQTPQYYPMVFSMFWVEYQLWELNPMGYHVVNVLLHALSVGLVWLLMRRLRIPGAWLVASIFALHPMMVESVAWITERKNVLSMFFYLLAALAYLRFDRLRFGWSAEDRDHRIASRDIWGWYGAALVLFILALLSKTVTCSLPAALILVLFWLRQPLTPKRLLPLAPMFVVGFALAMLTVVIERQHVGAVGEDFDYSLIERVLIGSKALLFYPWKLLWPHPLMFIYPRWEIDAGNVLQYWSVVAVMLIGIACMVALKRGWRGPFVALSFYAGTVFPAIGFFNVYPHLFSFVADHFVYHASLGIIALVVGAAATWLSAVVVRIASVPILFACFVLTWNHALVFANAETVYRDTIAKNPDAWMPRNNLSSILLVQAEQAMRAGREDLMEHAAHEAAKHARAALEVRPHHHTAHANLSEAKRLLGDLDAALDSMQRAVEHLPHFPLYRWQLGRLHHLRSEYDEAIKAYRAAVERSPRTVSYLIDLAMLLAHRDRHDEAVEAFRRVLDLEPENYLALRTLGAIRQQQARHAEAVDYYWRAIDAAETLEQQVEIVSRLIRLLLTSPDEEVRDIPEAIRLATQLVEVSEGRDPASLMVLATAYAAAEHFDHAERLAERAVALARQFEMRDLERQFLEELERIRRLREPTDPPGKENDEGSPLLPDDGG